MKKIICIFISAIMLISFTACSYTAENNDKVKIVTTIFPPYDFARQICGENAEIVMLLQPGTESHTYDPTPQDILRIKNADIFIYNGGESEKWVDEVITSVDKSRTEIISMMEIADTLEEHHDSEHSDTHDVHEYDEHVWTSPKNAIKITESIYKAVCHKDSSNTETYTENKDKYVEKLTELDNAFSNAAAESSGKPLIFGDRFPFLYFAEEFGIEYYAAFPGCAENTEPSASTIANLIDKVKSENIPVVFFIEFSNQKIADTICEATGAKKLLFHSCHNVTADEYKSGVTYLQLMEQNLANFREALK